MADNATLHRRIPLRSQKDPIFRSLGRPLKSTSMSVDCYCDIICCPSLFGHPHAARQLPKPIRCLSYSYQMATPTSFPCCFPPCFPPCSNYDSSIHLVASFFLIYSCRSAHMHL